MKQNNNRLIYICIFIGICFFAYAFLREKQNDEKPNDAVVDVIKNKPVVLKPAAAVKVADVPIASPAPKVQAPVLSPTPFEKRFCKDLANYNCINEIESNSQSVTATSSTQCAEFNNGCVNLTTTAVPKSKERDEESNRPFSCMFHINGVLQFVEGEGESLREALSNAINKCNAIE